MSLEDAFGKVEKPAEEKKLEIIESEESIRDKILVELLVYFEKNKYKEIYNFDDFEEHLIPCADFLKSVELNPEIISEFNARMKSAVKEDEKKAFGLYLSALIQTSYNQGCNNFVFDNVGTHFGAFLKGQPENPIKITAKAIKGCFNLWHANRCTLTAENIEGDNSLYSANGCVAEITNYKGISFGCFMKDCIIKSKNKETIARIKGQTTEYCRFRLNNKFELIK